MNDLSPSIFTIVVDRTPAVVFGCKKHSEAEAICADERIRSKLSSMISGGKPLLDDYSILYVRLARSDERAVYYEESRSRPNEGSMLMVQLVETDRLPRGQSSPKVVLMVSVDHFAFELRSQLRAAAAQGATSIVITSGELSESIRMGSASLEACCEAMQLEVRRGDTVIREKEVGVGMSVRYQLPRP